MISAVTDPRLTGMFHDVRLDRTYVHHSDGFDLLASEMPGRLTMPLNQWLPARYLAAFRWPVPAQRLEKRTDRFTDGMQLTALGAAADADGAELT